jgi:hypothetical protein
MVKRFRVRRYDEFRPKADWKYVPEDVRGVYALLKKRRITRRHLKARYDVVYVGMSTSGRYVRGRLYDHKRSKDKLWDHFTIFQADGDTTDRAIKDMEGILRIIYRKDSRANRWNVARGYGKLKSRKRPLKDW